MTARVLVALGLLLFSLGCGSPAPAGACPMVGGTWNVTGALRSDNTCTSSGPISVVQSICAVGFYTAGTGPDGGTAIFSCTLDSTGHCTTVAGGSVNISVALSATSGTVTFVESISGVSCPSQWTR